MPRSGRVRLMFTAQTTGAVHKHRTRLPYSTTITDQHFWCPYLIAHHNNHQSLGSRDQCLLPQTSTSSPKRQSPSLLHHRQDLTQHRPATQGRARPGNLDGPCLQVLILRLHAPSTSAVFLCLACQSSDRLHPVSVPSVPSPRPDPHYRARA